MNARFGLAIFVPRTQRTQIWVCHKPKKIA
jgi:hypothetical protein